MDTSTYYDFSQCFKWSWRIQSYLFKDISFYYDIPQHAYCRKINNVKGKIEDGWFIPSHWLVHYRQLITLN